MESAVRLILRLDTRAAPVLLAKDWGGTKHDRQEFFAPEEVTLQDVADHIEHVCELAGNTLHAAIGGDTDGQGGAVGAPFDVDTVADYQKVADVLAERGWGDAEIENVMYRNWQRFFEETLPAA